MATSPSQAKNALLRSLRGIVDPYPTSTGVGKVWAHFKSKCAYCGKKLKRSDRNGHQDHLVTFQDGGGNDLGNYVLACGGCNGDEKREEAWETFLRRKNPKEATFLRRKATIEAWVTSNAATRRYIPEEHRNAVTDAFERITSVLNAAIEQLRALKHPLASSPKPCSESAL